MLLWVKNGEFAGGGWRPKCCTEEVLATWTGSPPVTAPGLGGPMSWEQACPGGPALLSQRRHYSQRSGSCLPTLSLFCMWICLHMCVYTYGYVRMTCIHMFVCVYIGAETSMKGYELGCYMGYGRGVLPKTNKEWKDCTKMPRFPDSCVQLPI